MSDRDIEALVLGDRLASEEVYALESFVVNSGSGIDASANISLKKKDGSIQKASALGDGQVEAAFSAINAIVGLNPELRDYTIHSVSEGEDAQGEVTVKLFCDGRMVTGRGLSIDVIEASIRAYVSGVNKLLID